MREKVRKKFSVRLGWAQRLPYGKTLDKNTVYKYSRGIEEFFYAGERDEGKKMSAVMMRNALEQKHSGRYTQ